MAGKGTVEIFCGSAKIGKLTRLGRHLTVVRFESLAGVLHACAARRGEGGVSRLTDAVLASTTQVGWDLLRSLI